MPSHLGSKIRSLRRRQNRTLADVADRCGFTISLLSKIEAGKTNPPVATVSRIAAALGIGLGDLLDETRQKSTTVTSARSLTTATLTDKGYMFHLLAAERSEKLMQPFLMTAERGKVKPGTLAHRGEEFVFVLEGRMRYRVGDTTHTLGRGDSIYFDSEEDHDLEPITKTVRYLAVFVERDTPGKPAGVRKGKKS